MRVSGERSKVIRPNFVSMTSALAAAVVLFVGCGGQRCPDVDGSRVPEAHPAGRVLFRKSFALHPDCEFEVLAELECIVEVKDRDPGPWLQEARRYILADCEALGGDAVLDVEEDLKYYSDPGFWVLRGSAIRFKNYECRCGTGKVYY